MDFDKFVRAHNEAKEVPSPEKAKKQVQIFNDRLNQLHEIAYKALNPYVERGSVKISSEQVKLVEEEFYGYRNYSYEANELVITLGDSEVKLIPLGIRIIGAAARVDMIGPRGKIAILLTGPNGPRVRVSFSEGETPAEPPVQEPKEEPVWKFVERSPSLHYLDVNEDTFKEYLMKVIDG